MKIVADHLKMEIGYTLMMKTQFRYPVTIHNHFIELDVLKLFSSIETRIRIM